MSSFAAVFTVNSPALELERKCVGAGMWLCSLHVLTWGEEVAEEVVGVQKTWKPVDKGWI